MIQATVADVSAIIEAAEVILPAAVPNVAPVVGVSGCNVPSCRDMRFFSSPVVFHLPCCYHCRSESVTESRLRFSKLLVETNFLLSKII
jgi:hypothetical protein